MSKQSNRGGIVYGARNRENGKWYVGQTIHALKVRMRGHLSRSRKGSDQAFHEALRKYGVEGFDLHILAVCKDHAEMNAAERFWIKKLKSMAHNGYNLTDGGEGSIPCEEVRRRMSESSKGRPPVSEATRALISAAGKGRKRSEESIRKTTEAQRGKPRPHVAAMQKWKIISEETKRKISESVKKIMTPEWRETIATRQKQVAKERYHLTKKAARERDLQERGCVPQYGRKWTEQRKKEHSEKLKGRKFTEEHKAKIAAALKEKLRRRKSEVGLG